MEKIEFKDLPDTTTPLNASNLNLLQDNVEETLNIYSTDEVIIGTWLGEPFYRKVINFGSLPNATSKNVSTGLTNIKLKRIYGYCENETDLTCLNLPHLSSESSYNISILYRYNNNSIEIYTGTNRTSYNAIVVLEYTKITE